MKKIFKILFNRANLIIISIILQLSLYIIVPIVINYFYPLVINNYYIPFSSLMSVIAVILVIRIINSDMTVEGQLPLIILCIIVPVVGVAVCSLYVKTKIPRKQKKYASATKDCIKRENKNFENEQNHFKEIMGDDFGIFNYIYNSTSLRPYENTNVEFYKSGEAFFESLFNELKLAKKYIFMEYFIIEQGEIWNELYGILKNKVSQGVEVRLMYDDLGTIYKLPSNFAKKLKDDGIKCVKFNEYASATSAFYNNRDHRKITVIDGKVGFMGGVNLADEYANITHPFGYWKDTALKLQGEAVKGLLQMLLQLYSIQEKIFEEFSNYFVETPKIDNGVVCPFGDGPKYFYGDHISENIYINLISKASKSIYITTPYLILDSRLKSALILASKRGVDVKIVTPHIPDKKLIFSITRSNYRALQEAGVQILEYSKGFIHAKQILVDEKFAIVGTINMDYRSLLHHYECGTLMYKTSCLIDIKNDFNEIFSDSIDMKDYKQKTLVRIFCALIKLFTPML